MTPVDLSLIETAKANNRNIYQYMYTLLLYMSDYKEESAGIKQLLPWAGGYSPLTTNLV